MSDSNQTEAEGWKNQWKGININAYTTGSRILRKYHCFCKELSEYGDPTSQARKKSECTRLDEWQTKKCYKEKKLFASFSFVSSNQTESSWREKKHQARVSNSKLRGYLLRLPNQRNQQIYELSKRFSHYTQRTKWNILPSYWATTQWIGNQSTKQHKHATTSTHKQQQISKWKKACTQVATRAITIEWSHSVLQQKPK